MRSMRTTTSTPSRGGQRTSATALAERVKQYNGMDFDPETEITVTCGSTEAMMASMLAIIQPGDEVIVPEPFYENYGPDTADLRCRAPVRPA